MHDKENSLSFQNITQTMKAKRCKRQGICYYHSQRPAKYRDRNSDFLYCTSCAIQEASQGALLQQCWRRQQETKKSILSEIYEQCQNKIQEYIRTYNRAYQTLLDSLTDLQIKDLLSFNRKLEDNHLMYQQMKVSSQKNWSAQQLKNTFSSIDHQSIISRIQSFGKNIFPTRIDNSTNFSFKQHLSPSNLSRNPSDFPRAKQLKQSNKSLRDLPVISRQSSRLSFNLQNQTNSLKSKNSSTIEEIKKSVYEDTPQSIKNQLSDNSFRVTSKMAIQMFEKIDVCESVDISQSQKMKSGIQRSNGSGQARSSYSSFKSRYRYQNNNQISS